MIDAFRQEFARYRKLAEKALVQVNDRDFMRALSDEGNSIAVVAKHTGGNLRSRFSEFLTSDGEKVWRQRDAEFVTDADNRASIEELWREGWTILEATLAELSDEDLAKSVRIRGVPHTVPEALARSLGHISYHVGQIVLLAKHWTGGDWQPLTIPKGGSDAYNANPTREKG